MATRLLFLDHAPLVGGAQLALAEHIRHLDRARFEAHVLCSGEHAGLVEAFERAGARVHLFAWPRLKHLTPSRAAGVLRATLQLRRAIRGIDPDVVIANTSRTAYTSALAGVSRRRPVVWWVRDFDFGLRVFRAVKSRATAIVAVSDAIRSHYLGSDVSRCRVVYVASGIESGLQGVSEDSVAAARAAYGFGPTDTIIGYMGRLVEGKGPQDLISAFTRLTGEFPAARLLIVGTGAGQEGDVEARLRESVRAAGLEDVVRFAGFQTNEPLHYRLFDLFVLSSRYREAMPTSVIQAMFARKPVVATATGGTPEVVADGVTGLLVPPSSPDDLHAALRRLLTDPALSRDLAERGYQHAAAYHRESAATRELEALYESLVEDRR